uniref:Uncharacterized protein n=1 Tax=Rhizophora mucronata TaxID=61149 RepID=A0A2P2N9X3_RHIMU
MRERNLTSDSLSWIASNQELSTSFVIYYSVGVIMFIECELQLIASFLKGRKHLNIYQEKKNLS